LCFYARDRLAVNQNIRLFVGKRLRHALMATLWGSYQ